MLSAVKNMKGLKTEKAEWPLTLVTNNVLGSTMIFPPEYASTEVCAF